MYLESVDSKFSIIKNADCIDTNGYDGTVFDLFISLDTASLDRLGQNLPFFANAKRTACVDHHKSNSGYADYNYILPDASSASEVLYDLLEDDMIDKSVAEPLYMGIAPVSYTHLLEGVSRKLSDLLDEEDFISDAYILEVSSPGLGRPLKKDRDFDRSIGEEIEVHLYRSLNGNKQYVGLLKSYDKDTITIEDEDGSEIALDRVNVSLVRLTIDF